LNTLKDETVEENQADFTATDEAGNSWISEWVGGKINAIAMV
jgi:hypothetical protein